MRTVAPRRRHVDRPGRLTPRERPSPRARPRALDRGYDDEPWPATGVTSRRHAARPDSSRPPRERSRPCTSVTAALTDTTVERAVDASAHTIAQACRSAVPVAAAAPVSSVSGGVMGARRRSRIDSMKPLAAPPEIRLSSHTHLRLRLGRSKRVTRWPRAPCTTRTSMRLGPGRRPLGGGRSALRLLTPDGARRDGWEVSILGTQSGGQNEREPDRCGSPRSDGSDWMVWWVRSGPGRGRVLGRARCSVPVTGSLNGLAAVAWQMCGLLRIRSCVDRLR